MNPPNRTFDKWFYLAAVAVVLFCTYIVATSIDAARNTSVLRVSSSADKTVLTISQPNKQAEFIGRGHASVRLKPGTYTVAASQTGKQIFKDVQILKDKSTAIILDPKNAAVLPSVQGVDFDGFSKLINGGLTTLQVDRLKHYLFQFKPTAKKMVISEGSFKPAPRDPDTAVGFSSNFVVLIDSSPNSAKINYSYPDNPEGIQLNIYNAAGALVFDSATPQ